MRKGRIAAVVITAAVLCTGLALAQQQQQPQQAILAFLAGLHAPEKSFDQLTPPPAPDYSQKSAWAAYGSLWPGDGEPFDQARAPAMPPPTPQPTDAVPAGMVKGDDIMAARVDVFFIYPTSFFSNEQWNAAVDDAATNERTDSGSLRAQASVFNGCCRIYAPRYRQMTFGGFVQPSESATKAMALAYSDVKRAFEYYLAHFNHGRPFIIASHSQGSRHATTLITEMIDGTPLMRQFVAAYVVGTWLPQSWFDKMRDVKPCDRADDTGCVATWSTLLEGVDGAKARAEFAARGGHPAAFADQPFVCTNPLTWSPGKELAPAELDLGGWAPGRSQEARPIVPHLVSARCDNGGLFVSRPEGLVFNILVMPGGNYHNYDYQLAWMNIRKNAQDRVNAFLAKGK